MRLINMRLSLILYFVVTALGVQQTVSLPFDKRADADADETFTLTFALEFEYLAVAFYTHGLALFKETDFIKAGFTVVFQRFQQMLTHEKTHAQLLANILGKTAPKPCEYSFSFSSVAAFVKASLLIEGVSASVYIGAMPFLTNETVQDASAILSTEARHAAYVATVVQVDPWGGPFDTPITLDDAFTLASHFTTSCPSTNPRLGLSELSTFNITGLPTPGQTITLQLPPIAEHATHVAFFSGLSVSFVDIIDGQVVIPRNISGIAYAFATNASGSEPLIETLAGPTVIFIQTHSNHRLIN